MKTVAAPARQNRIVLGIFFMCCAGTLFPIMNGLVQVLSPRYPSEQIVGVRTAAHLIIILAMFAPRYGIVGLVRTTQPKWQIARSIALLMSTNLFFFGVKHLPLAKAASISFTAPLIVAMLAWPILGERVSLNRFIAVVVGFIGVLVVVQPGTELFQWASLNIVGSAICYACYQIFTRYVAGHDRPETSAVYSALVGTLIMGAVVPWTWVSFHNWTDAAIMFSLGLLGGVGHYCVARAMIYAPANIVAPFQYWQMLGSVAVGYMITSKFPEATTWLGAAIICCSGLYIGWRETRERQVVRAQT
jgi:drug/metabolite transporter (DMT)-like permease